MAVELNNETNIIGTSNITSAYLKSGDQFIIDRIVWTVVESNARTTRAARITFATQSSPNGDVIVPDVHEQTFTTDTLWLGNARRINNFNRAFNQLSA